MPSRRNRVKETDRKANKPWLKRKQPGPATSPIITAKRAFLILCEGHTERDYFATFSGNGVALKAEVLGVTKLELVDCAIEYRDGTTYDEVWVVYDQDFNPAEGEDQFERARMSLERAAQNDIQVAYSNDVFELWLRLHYEAITGPLSRRQLYKDLSNRWSINYEREGKKRDFRKSIRERLTDDAAASEQAAIERAKDLFTERGALPHAQQNPLTTVHHLVLRLLAAGRE
ncbi:RloB family protein [Neolewinella sp.]|uniref:RloB family protein n=1 Tax=Neolewinella sp. TaxID=2993543 RepID=UPI003B516213